VAYDVKKRFSPCSTALLVSIGFAENFELYSIGRRVLNMLVSGEVFQSNFDVLAAAKECLRQLF